MPMLNLVRKTPVYRSFLTVFYLIFYITILFCNSCAKPAALEAEENPQIVLAAEANLQKRVAMWDLAYQMAMSMDDSCIAAQVLMSGIDGSINLDEKSAALLMEIPVGAVMLFAYNLVGTPEDIQQFTSQCTDAVLYGNMDVPPFIAVDHEGGKVHRFGDIATHLPEPGSFGRAAKQIGVQEVLVNLKKVAFSSGMELCYLGFSLNMAPIAEVLNEDNVDFLKDRSYGEDPIFVEKAASAFIQGMEEAGIACAVKHFPGNSGLDPHRNAVYLDWDTMKLDAAAGIFKDVIQASDPAIVMVSHGVVTSIDTKKPGSLSYDLMTDYLKGRLAFQGIVLTDDFRMAAIASTGRKPQEAAVEALNAGADMVMTWQKDLSMIHQKLLSAVQDGTLPRTRLVDAVSRILFMKLKHGLIPHPSNSKIIQDNIILEKLKQNTESILKESVVQ